jgi:hypothetical protein
MRPYALPGRSDFVKEQTMVVSGVFSAVGQSELFHALGGHTFNVSGWGSFSGSVQLERSFDKGVTWLYLTAAGTQIYIWQSAFSESAEEHEYNVLYRFNCTALTSGQINYRMSM